jgi:hypothetical protein
MGAFAAAFALCFALGPQEVATSCGGEPSAGAPASEAASRYTNTTKDTNDTAGADAVAAVAVRGRDAVAGALAAALLLGGAAYVRANERRRRALAAPAPSTVLTSATVAPRARFDATPYWTGAALGAVFAISLVALRHPVGVSGAIQSLAGLVGRRLDPATRYWGHAFPVGNTWQVRVLAGLILGALFGATMRGALRPTTLPDGWAETWGRSRARRFAIAFAGGALVEFAGAIAGGCTSGLALSGGIVLSPGAFVFMAAMFAAGIPSAWLVERRR